MLFLKLDAIAAGGIGLKKKIHRKPVPAILGTPPQRAIIGSASWGNQNKKADRPGYRVAESRMGYPQEKALLPNYVDLPTSSFPAAKKPRVRPHLQFLFGAVVLSIIISCSHQFPTSNLDVLRQEFLTLQVGIFQRCKKLEILEIYLCYFF